MSLEKLERVVNLDTIFHSLGTIVQIEKRAWIFFSTFNQLNAVNVRLINDNKI